MPWVDQAAVEALLDPNTPSVETAISVVTVLAKAYTRGHGFDGAEPNEDIQAVITTAAARLAANGAQLRRAMEGGPFTLDLRSAFEGWTTAELAALNRYRKRAQ